jgi:hypothetical protein
MPTPRTVGLKMATTGGGEGSIGGAGAGLGEGVGLPEAYLTPDAPRLRRDRPLLRPGVLHEVLAPPPRAKRDAPVEVLAGELDKLRADAGLVARTYKKALLKLHPDKLRHQNLGAKVSTPLSDRDPD